MERKIRVEARSEPEVALLGGRPGFLVRYGMTMLLGVVLSLLLLSWLLRYPDVVEGDIVLQTADRPKMLTAPVTGRIFQLSVQEGDDVRADQSLAVVEDAASYEDISLLERRLREWGGAGKPLDLPGNLRLGDLTGAYHALQDRVGAYRTEILESGRAVREIDLVEQQIAKQRALAERLVARKRLTMEDIDLAQRDLDAHQVLYKQGLISESVMAERKIQANERQAQLNELEQSSIRADMELRTLENRLLEQQRRKEELVRSVSDGIAGLLMEIERWKRQHVVRAPLAGKVSLSPKCSENTEIRAGDELLTVIPGGTKIAGEIQLDQQGTGRLQLGERVIVSFPSYPPEQYGTVDAVVTHISSMSRDNRFLIIAEFPKGLTSSLNQTLPFKPGLLGHAKIVTQDVRLLMRFFRRTRLAAGEAL